MFGGSRAFGPPYQLNDVWVLTNADGTGGTATWTQLNVTGALPPGRVGAGGAYDPNTNRLIIFGGSGDGSCPCPLLNDVWVLTNANGTAAAAPTWIRLTPTGGPPVVRANFVFSYHPTSNQAIVHGGFNPSLGALSDTWVLNNTNGVGGSPAWQQVVVSGSSPQRVSGIGAYDPNSNRLITWGGDPIHWPTSVDDYRILTNATGASGTAVWSQLSTSGPQPFPRESPTAVYDAPLNRLITFGGGIVTTFNDIWVLANASGTSGTTLKIDQVLPNRGGNAGSVTMQIIGAGFQDGATAKLNGVGPDIAGSATSANASGLTTTFNLIGAAPGMRTVTVTNPNNTAVSLPIAFNVEQGGSATIWVDVVGRDRYRVGRDQTLYVLVGNRGNIDAHAVPLWIEGIPINATWMLESKVIEPPLPAGISVDWNQFPVQLSNSTTTTVPLLLGSIPPDSIKTVPIRLNVPTLQTVGLRAGVSTPFFQSPLADAWTACGTAYVDYVIKGLQAVPGLGCTAALVTHFGGEALDVVRLHKEAPTGTFDSVTPLLHFGVGAATRGLHLAEECGAHLFPPAAIALEAFHAWEAAMALQNFRNECGLALFVTSFRLFNTAGATSIDPNEKVGSQGVGATRHVSDQEPLRYSVFFENKVSAGAAAQDVVITDVIDVSRINLSTLVLGSIAFADKIITPPELPLSAVGTYSATVDLRPVNNLLVRVTAELNATNGLLTWKFNSLDPATGQPPEDPLAGFLPPGAGGSVLFTARTKNGLATGTQIRNNASIVFDTNGPIVTPEWLNTIDGASPTSTVLPLSLTQSITSFDVGWSGNDLGAGVAAYDVFVSDNDGPFTAWLRQTTATQATFTGINGHTYRFYSIARDLVGNIEAAKTGAEATTRIVTDTTPPLITSNVAGTLGANGWYRSNVTVSWNVSDPESSIASSTGCSTTTLTVDTAGTQVTCSAANGAGLSISESVTIKIDKTAPQINIASPGTGPYILNAPVTASYGCTDAGSGVAVCTGSVANGGKVTTSQVNSNTFVVNATDSAGNTSSKTVTYKVHYDVRGFFPPTDNLPVANSVKAGSVVPMKWQLLDAAGLYIADIASLTGTTQSAIACDAAPVDAIEQTVSPGGTVFRYDSTANQFIYNWQTAATWVGTCRIFQITLKDGNVKQAKFQFK
jgi:hypothetical protein